MTVISEPSRLHALFREQRGVVYLEVIMALMPLLLTFLGICQLALLYAGQLVVQHAATRAARAAIVVLEDDPEYYDDAPRGSLIAGKANSESGTPESLQQEYEGDFSSALASSPLSADTESSDSDAGFGARWSAIAAAAYHPLSVLAPSPFALLTQTLGNELTSDALWRVVFGRFVYSRGAAEVTLRSGDGERALTTVGKNDTIRVRVSFLMPCGVPLVSAFICIGRVSTILAQIGLISDKSSQSLIDGTQHVESTLTRNLILAGMSHLILLTAEASMPNQGADYYGDGE